MSRNSHRPGSKSARKRRGHRAKALLAAQKRWNKNPAPVGPAEKKMVGSHIINLENLSENIAKVSEHSAKCMGNCQMIEEVSRKGLASVFLVQCEKCGEKFHLETSTKAKGRGGRYTVNIGAVWGQISTGGGHANLNEAAVALDLPGMASKTFSRKLEWLGKPILQKRWLKLAMKNEN